jgi:antitoxin (DNA-binding transcriptional repressor) of toxin-antitoxin stability system
VPAEAADTVPAVVTAQGAPVADITSAEDPLEAADIAREAVPLAAAVDPARGEAPLAAAGDADRDSEDRIRSCQGRAGGVITGAADAGLR